jgi:hypothetical protein
MFRTPTELAQDQLLAYNAKDLDAFCACYSEDVRVWRMPADTPRLAGREAFRESYRAGPFAEAQVQAAIAQRIVMGNIVIDHELVHGRSEQPQQVAVVYHCRDGLIAEVYFYAPD